MLVSIHYSYYYKLVHVDLAVIADEEVQWDYVIKWVQVDPWTMKDNAEAAMHFLSINEEVR